MLYTPKKTIKTIVESGNHYVAQVKRNQPNLYEAIERTICNEAPVDYQVFKQKNKGQYCSWYVSVYEAHIGKLNKKWAGLKKIIHVHKVVEKASAAQKHSDRLYISDLKTNNAAAFHKGIKDHWKIENLLHRVKDVIHREDRNRIRTGNGPINMSIISTRAINIHRSSSQRPIVENQIKFGYDLANPLKFIRT
jgi:predicted transposase YbfD/YdcC